MTDFDFKIGLAFSGGGYRASAYNLGLLGYLDRVSFGSSSLLQKVVGLSTVSGGTITGARYAIGLKRGETFEDFYKAMYHFMLDVNLIELSLDNLVKSNRWPSLRMKSLVNAVADVYDKELFREEKFKCLLTDEYPIHLKHISFNATEFSNALQFRFQVTPKLDKEISEFENGGIIGNFYYRIPVAQAEGIRMGDIVAASSCFPGGFEPINFPNDFGPEVSSKSAPDNKGKFPVGLMDGGIVDNQGIEPLLLIEKRMQKNADSSDAKYFDLIILSDVTSPYMDGYKVSEHGNENLLRKLSLRTIAVGLLVAFVLSISGMTISLVLGYRFGVILTTMLATVSMMAILLGYLIKSSASKFGIPSVFLKPLRKLLKLRISVYENLLKNRAKSLLKLTNNVFLKHIRRLNYSKIYEDSNWVNRRIMTAIYELREEEESIEKKIILRQECDTKLNPHLIPSAAMRKVAGNASEMETTLWFTKEDIVCKDMLNSIIACGQFSICYNLLEYLEKIENSSTNTNENHLALLGCKEQLMRDWKKFNADPFWLVKSMNDANHASL